MSLRKLPSGSWNYRQMIDGRSFSLTFDHKPTKKEIDAELFERRKDLNKSPIKGTFKDYAKIYLEDKDSVLSPSTLKNYNSVLRNLSDSFCDTRMSTITQVDIQREINNYSKTRSPKSTKNASGFITVVMRYFRPEIVINTKLPQNVKVETYIPTDEEVKKVLEAIKGSPYEAAILLALLGLRRSELISIMPEDISGNILTINKAKVVTEDGSYTIKTTKTESSTREIYIPDYVADLIRKQGYAYKGFPGNILRYLHNTQDRLGINRCKLHALRHYYVSYAHSQGIPDAYIAKAVGHSNIATTQRIYTHAQQDHITEMQIKAAQFLA